MSHQAGQTCAITVSSDVMADLTLRLSKYQGVGAEAEYAFTKLTFVLCMWLFADHSSNLVRTLGSQHKFCTMLLSNPASWLL
eukprot:3765981-Amphidinium_carterae.1